MEKKKLLVSLSKFLPDDKEILKIIEICDLDPIDSWRKWSDHCGNTIVVPDNKRPLIISQYEPNPKIRDIHFKSNIKSLSKQSNWAMVTFANSVQNQISNTMFCWLYGADNLLRMACYIRNDWIENQLPLTSGMKTLRTIVRNLSAERVIVLNGDREVRCPLQTNAVKTWITPWPPNKQTQLDMLLINKFLASDILKQTGNI